MADAQRKRLQRPVVMIHAATAATVKASAIRLTRALPVSGCLPRAGLAVKDHDEEKTETEKGLEQRE